MPIRDSLEFNYNGISSFDMGLLNVNYSTGLLEEPFLAERSILERKIRGNPKPYFQGVEESPLVVNLTFAFTDTWDEKKIREIARWLRQDYYKPLYFSDNPNRIFYCLYTGSPTLLHNGLKQGMINIQMRCDSPYAYSPTYISPEYDLSNNTIEGTLIQFINDGDTELYPEISIIKNGVGDIEFYNQTNGNKYFKLTNIDDNEEIYLNCEKEIIISSLPNIYRYDNFSGEFLKIIYGINNILIKGNCKVKFRWRYRIIQG